MSTQEMRYAFCERGVQRRTRKGANHDTDAQRAARGRARTTPAPRRPQPIALDHCRRDPANIAADLTTTKPVESLPEDEPGLLALARAAALAGENILALSCEDGQRQKLWPGSPVPGNLFR